MPNASTLQSLPVWQQLLLMNFDPDAQSSQVQQEGGQKSLSHGSTSSFSSRRAALTDHYITNSVQTLNFIYIALFMLKMQCKVLYKLKLTRMCTYPHTDTQFKND